MNQIERIQQMEKLYDLAWSALKKESISRQAYEEVQEAMMELSEYYSSLEWKKDFADDEAGLLPKDLKRGVLSEDGIWDLQEEWSDWNKRLMANGEISYRTIMTADCYRIKTTKENEL